MQQAALEPMLHEHLHEFRRRLSWSVGIFVLGTGAGYALRNQLVSWLQHPLNQHLYYTSPTGSFEIIMKLSMLVGLLLALPIAIYHILRFVEPAFPRRFTKKLMALVILCSLSLAIAGVAFAYYVSLPAALRFFANVSSQQITALINVNQYFSFVFAYLVTFAVVFQLPLILFFIDHVTPIDPGKMGGWRKFVFVGAFAIAIVTPSAPDPLSQVILALPIILLYEISLILLRLRHWRMNKRAPSTIPEAVTAPALETPEKHADRSAPLRAVAKPKTEVAQRYKAARLPTHFRMQSKSVLDLRTPTVTNQKTMKAFDLRPTGNN